MEGSKASASVSTHSADIHNEGSQYDNVNSHLISADIALQTIRQADDKAMMHHICDHTPDFGSNAAALHIQRSTWMYSLTTALPLCSETSYVISRLP